MNATDAKTSLSESRNYAVQNTETLSIIIRANDYILQLLECYRCTNDCIHTTPYVWHCVCVYLYGVVMYSIFIYRSNSNSASDIFI